MRIMFFRCDSCKKETSGLGLPPSLPEVRFFNQRDYFYHFDGYSCLAKWVEARERHYQNKFVGEEVTVNEE